jgi:membrane protein implicated in regulation of membrane protease activity
MIAVWGVLALVFLGIELVTTQLVLGYFGIGALVALTLAATGSSDATQVVVFLAVSIGLIVLTRRPLKGMLNRNSPLVAMNVNALAGRRATVTEEIDNDAGTGYIRIGDEVWRARSADGVAVAADALVTVERIEGVTAWVRVAVG